MQTPFDAEPPYPRARAFLIQFHRDADMTSGQCLGRVEQITAFGDAREFNSAQELLTYLEAKLAERNRLVP